MPKIKKYNNLKNISGSLIESAIKEKHLSNKEVCEKLELLGVYIDRNELLLIKKNKLLVKDFELVAISKVLDIDLNNLKDYLKD